MSLIKCPECGHEISDLAASCPQCGCPVGHQVGNHFDTPLSAGEPTLGQPAKNKAVGTIVVISLLIVALAGVAAWYLFFRGGTDEDERTVYDRIMCYENEHQLDSLGEALNDYFDTYNSDAFHYSQLKELNDRFFAERADWQAADGLKSLDAVRHFLDVHPDGFYLNEANLQLDSLSYIEAQEVNTREAYEHYIEQFSQGKYVTEARWQIAGLDNVELSIDEKATVREALSVHFDALGNNDKGAISMTLASDISSYIGKADPELEDIYAYMSNMHSSGRTIIFNVKGAEITKIDMNGRNMYSVQFMLEEEILSHNPHETLDTESGTPAEAEKPAGEIKKFKGVAVLNEGMKITSLVLRTASTE